MEFPDLGAQCSVKSCCQLDFLPIKCADCSSIFCKDHFSHTNHDCPNAPLKDYQVPVCPLCNEPVAMKRGQLPDISVSQHIDDECQDDRAKKKRKNTNKCTLKGCKNKQLVPILCSECKLNFCLRHRYPSDHSCNPREARIPKDFREFGATASSSSSSDFPAPIRSSRPFKNILSSLVGAGSRGPGGFRRKQRAPTLHDEISEDEALARAIAASLDTAEHVTSPPEASSSLQEEEDRMMAEAIAASKREAQLSHSRTLHEPNCKMS